MKRKDDIAWFMEIIRKCRAGNVFHLFTCDWWRSPEYSVKTDWGNLRGKRQTHSLLPILQGSQVDTEAKYYMLTPSKKNLISAQRLWCCPGGHFIVLLEKAKGDHLASLPASLRNFNYCFFLHNLLWDLHSRKK